MKEVLFTLGFSCRSLFPEGEGKVSVNQQVVCVVETGY